MIKYPIGVQNFESLRKENYLYIDKTELIYKLAHTGRYYFLSRPRRFGKSLLVSTLESYFEGKKELFNGLAIETYEKEWIRYPVFHMDLNGRQYDSREKLIAKLEATLGLWEKLYGLAASTKPYDMRFDDVIQNVYDKYGQSVVILIDEYDKPLLDNFDNPDLQNELRNILRPFYATLKSKDRCIRFALLTGVSKFGKLSVFSDLNNLKDISMDTRYVELCGITEKEIKEYLEDPLHTMADKLDLGYDEMCRCLRCQYDGYHFERDTAGLYNPFSLLNAFDGMTLKDYWFETGTPSFLVEALKRADYDLNRLSGEEQTSDMLNSIDDTVKNPIPLLYQSGYLTIKGYDERFRLYKLGFPNDEVRRGFINYLLPRFSPCNDSESAFYIRHFVKEIETGDVKGFMDRLQTLFADNSYQIMGKMEVYFQNAMYVLFKVLGFYVAVEHTTHRGRIDLLIKTSSYIYIIEIKLDGSAEEALKQINEKGYAEPFAKDSRKLFKVGVNFSSVTRGIEAWKVE